MNDMYAILQRPHLTEKGDSLQEEQGKIVIRVDARANKAEIKKAVEKFFNVKVGKVWTARIPGKQKRVGKYSGHTSDWKKAIITLTEGKINFLEEL